MRVLGIDPGYDRVGTAVIEKLPRIKEQLLYSSCIQTNAQDTFEQRLSVIGTAIEELIAEYTPEAIAIEKLYFEKNQKTAMLVAEARGVLRYIAAQHGLPVYEYTPLEIKVAVSGDGRASKGQVMRMLPKLVSIEKEIRFDDEYDAIAIGLTCLTTKRQ